MQLTTPEIQKRRVKVKQLYLTGFSASDIAKQLDTNSWNVLADLKVLGIARRRQGATAQPPSDRCKLIAETYLQGNKSQREVGMEFGISYFAVNRHVARYLRNNPSKRRKQ